LADHVKSIISSHFPNYNNLSVGIEIRYNFNPNDSSRLRKDVDMADLLTNNGYFPIYLIFSSISPREDAISRLTRGGWNFLIGNQAASFMNELLNVDITAILDVPSIREEIRTEVTSIMRELFNTYAFRQACGS